MTFVAREFIGIAISLIYFAVSTSQYAHYVFNAIDRDSNGSVSFEVIPGEIREAESTINAEPD